MKSISLNITKAASFLAEGAVKAYEPKVKAAQEALENGTCEGNDFLGWLHLPSSITPEFLNEIQAIANTLREKCEVVVSVVATSVHVPLSKVSATLSHGSLTTRRTQLSSSQVTTSVRITSSS